MAVTRRTLRLIARLRRVVGTLADDTVRDLAKAWTRSWGRLAAGWREAASDLAATALQLDRWPGPWDVARIGSVQSSLQATAAELDTLAIGAAGGVGDAAEQAIRAVGNLEPGIIGSQLPRGYPVRDPLEYALAAIITRTRQAITAQTRPLSDDAQRGLRAELVRGVALGQHPRNIAARVVDRVDGAFNGGLVRAFTIARTEVLDAMRTASRQVHNDNADVLAGWRWLATVEGKERTTRRTCPACWALHGSVHPLSEPGPAGHQNCRCARSPVTKSWTELGIDGDEPGDDFPDARAIFADLPRDQQVAILGAARHQMLTAGEIDWDDIPVLKRNPRWRDSWHPRTVADLRRIADSRRSAA